jgi:hemoglobin-like flavoprotein
MGQALVFTLKEMMGSDWNPDLERAWVDVFDQLSGEIMKTIFIEGKYF